MSAKIESIQKAIQEAERELLGLREKLKEYEDIRLKIANIETFIKSGNAMIGVTEQTIKEKADPITMTFPFAGTDSDSPAVQNKSNFDKILEILRDNNNKPMSLSEFAQEFQKRNWKLSKNNSRQVLRMATIKHLDVFKRTVEGVTTYYSLKQ